LRGHDRNIQLCSLVRSSAGLWSRRISGEKLRKTRVGLSAQREQAREAGQGPEEQKGAVHTSEPTYQPERVWLRTSPASPAGPTACEVVPREPGTGRLVSRIKLLYENATCSLAWLDGGSQAGPASASVSLPHAHCAICTTTALHAFSLSNSFRGLLDTCGQTGRVSFLLPPPPPRGSRQAGTCYLESFSQPVTA